MRLSFPDITWSVIQTSVYLTPTIPRFPYTPLFRSNSSPQRSRCRSRSHRLLRCAAPARDCCPRAANSCDSRTSNVGTPVTYQTHILSIACNKNMLDWKSIHLHSSYYQTPDYAIYLI